MNHHHITQAYSAEAHELAGKLTHAGRMAGWDDLPKSDEDLREAAVATEAAAKLALEAATRLLAIAEGMRALSKTAENQLEVAAE